MRIMKKKGIISVMFIAALGVFMMGGMHSVAAQEIMFIDSGQSIGDAEFTHNGVALGDLDQDGDLDAYVITYYTQPDQVWLNDGKGNFTDSGQTIDDGKWGSTSISLIDLDGDGDLDAFVTHNGSDPNSNDVWLNDGDGIFSSTEQSLRDGDACGATVGDIDGDGDFDVFVANPWNGADMVIINDGNANFSNTEQKIGDLFNCSVSLGDIDHDGDIDAFLGDACNANRGGCPQGVSDSSGRNAELWLNNGNGIFTKTQQLFASPSSVDVEFGDLNSDGSLDIFIAGTGNFYRGAPNRIWLNDGTGVFSDTEQSLGNSTSNDVTLGDLDGDGDIDVFVANGREHPNKIWLNDGAGIFTDSGLNLGNSDSMAVALGDLDDDGDIDAFVANKEGPNKIWLNQSPISGSTRIALDMDISTTNYEAASEIESQISACKEDEIWIAVVALNVTDLDTYQVEVSFDTDKLEFLEGAEENPMGGISNLLKKNGGTTTGFLAVEDVPGTVNISDTLTGADCDEAPEGSGALALLKFRVLSAGTDAELTLGNTFFVDCTGDNQGITDLRNGTFTVPAPIPGDFNKDGIVNFIDLGLLANNWLLTDSDSEWNPKSDLNADGIVNYLDLSILGDHWLEEGCS